MSGDEQHPTRGNSSFEITTQSALGPRCDECGRRGTHAIFCSKNPLDTAPDTADITTTRPRFQNSAGDTPTKQCDCDTPRYHLAESDVGPHRVQVLSCERCEAVVDTVAWYGDGGEQP